jgi:hypothetical protein
VKTRDLVKLNNNSIPTAPTKSSLFFNELQKTELYFGALAPKRRFAPSSTYTGAQFNMGRFAFMRDFSA